MGGGKEKLDIYFFFFLKGRSHSTKSSCYSHKALRLNEAARGLEASAVMVIMMLTAMLSWSLDEGWGCCLFGSHIVSHSFILLPAPCLLSTLHALILMNTLRSLSSLHSPFLSQTAHPSLTPQLVMKMSCEGARRAHLGASPRKWPLIASSSLFSPPSVRSPDIQRLCNMLKWGLKSAEWMPLVNLKLKWFWLARSNIWMLCTESSRAASLTVCLQQEMDFVQK